MAPDDTDQTDIHRSVVRKLNHSAMKVQRFKLKE